jgi:hypothetical protein
MPSRRRAKSRSISGALRAAYAIFYCGMTFGVGLLAYAGVFLAAPPVTAIGQADNGTRIARIQLDQSDGKGQCRQVTFDNLSGRFEEAGMGRCRHLIPEELLIDSLQARAGQTDAFIRAFRR